MFIENLSDGHSARYAAVLMWPHLLYSIVNIKLHHLQTAKL